VLGCGSNEESDPDEQGQFVEDVACLVGFRLDEVAPLVFGDFVFAGEFQCAMGYREKDDGVDEDLDAGANEVFPNQVGSACMKEERQEYEGKCDGIHHLDADGEFGLRELHGQVVPVSGSG